MNRFLHQSRMPAFSQWPPWRHQKHFWKGCSTTVSAYWQQEALDKHVWHLNDDGPARQESIKPASRCFELCFIYSTVLAISPTFTASLSVWQAILLHVSQWQNAVQLYLWLSSLLRACKAFCCFTRKYGIAVISPATDICFTTIKRMPTVLLPCWSATSFQCWILVKSFRRHF